MPEKLRIVLTTGNYNYIKDGVSLTLNRLVEWLEGQQIAEVLIVAPVGSEPALKHAGRLEPVPSIAIPTRKEYRVGFKLTQHLRERIGKFRPHLFHLAAPDLTGHSALRLAEQMRLPAVASFHTRFDAYVRYYHLTALETLAHSVMRKFYARCQHVYVPSYSMMEELRNCRIAGDNMRLWTRGIDRRRFSPARRSEAWRQRHGLTPDDVVVAYAGRLVAEKNTALLVDVFQKLIQRGSNCRTVLLGDGPESGWMRKALPETVFAGFLHGDDLAQAYASSDLFFFPSVTETFGNVTLEAMASGLPAVNADATGSRSLVEDGETGYLVDVREPDVMAARIDTLVRDAPLRRRMGQAALAKVKTDHDWDKIFLQLTRDYRDAIAGR